MVVQVGDQNVLRNGLKMDAFQIEIEVPVACCDCAFRQNNNFRDVDGAFDVEINGLRHYFRNIDLFRHPCKFALYRSDRQLNSLHQLFQSV